MTVEFERTIDDLVAWNLYVYNRSGLGRKRVWVAAAFVGVCFPLLAVWQYSAVGEPVVFAVWALSGVVFLFTYALYLRWCVRRSIRRNVETIAKGSTVSKHRVTLTDQGVEATESDGQKSFCPWNGVREIEKSDSHIFLYVGAATAHLIPLAAFPTPSEADAFVAEAQRLRGHQ